MTRKIVERWFYFSACDVSCDYGWNWVHSEHLGNMGNLDLQ